MFDHLYYLFYGWNGLDIIILALSFYLFYRLGKRKAAQAQATRRTYTPSAKPVIYDTGEAHKTPAIWRREK